MSKSGPKFGTVTLVEPIVRGAETIGILKIRKPDSGALRGLSLMEVVRMESGTLDELLPRITDPILHDDEVRALDPADRFACGLEIVGFFMAGKVNEPSPPTESSH